MKLPRLSSLVAAAVLTAAPAACFAQTFDFTYTGSPSLGGFFFYGITGASGSGSFTVDGSGDATSFVFDLSTFTFSGTDTFGYGLTDLESFSATVTNGEVTALSLLTDAQPGYYTPNTQFEVDNLGSSGAETFDFDVGGLTEGFVTVVPAGIPEPASAGLLTIAVLGAAVFRRTSQMFSR